MTSTVYDQVGGSEFFESLVDHFYDAVDSDPVLRPLYPDDLSDARSHLVGFLVQYWGGPTAYSDERGHPRLRMRHAGFRIGVAERDAWYGHMAEAVAASDTTAEVSEQLLAYFDMAATHLLNAG